MVFAASKQTSPGLPKQASQKLKSRNHGDADTGKEQLLRQRRQRMFQPSSFESIKFATRRQGSGVNPIIYPLDKRTGEAKTAFPPANFCGGSYPTPFDRDLAFWNDENSKKAVMVVRCRSLTQ